MSTDKVQIIIEAKDNASAAIKAIESAFQAMGISGKIVANSLDNSFSALSGAFKTLNLRSAFDIEKQRASLIAAFEQIKTSGIISATEIKRAHQALKEQLTGLDKELKGTGNSFLSLKGAVGSVGASLAGMGFVAMGKECVDASLKMTKLKSTLEAVSGADAGKEIDFLRTEVNRLGLDLSSTADSYGKFAAATKNTSIEGEKARKVFVGVAEAATALHLSADDTNGILLALQQMMSKGKVSAEELNQQLGERLPGALKLAADSMGITTSELMKQMGNGQVMADDLLPRLAEMLHLTYGDAAVKAAQEGQAAINRLNNEILESKAQVGKSLLPAYTAALQGTSTLAQGVAVLVEKYRQLTAAAVGYYHAKYTVTDASLSLSERIAKLKEIRDRVIEIWKDIDSEGAKSTGNMVQDALKRANIAIESGKSVAKIETDLTKKTKEEYEERKGAIEGYWSKAMALVAKGSDEYRRMEEGRKRELLQLEEQYSKKSLAAQRSAEEGKLKDAVKFAKASGDLDRQLVAEYQQKYEKKKAAIEDHYAEELKSTQKGAAAYILLEKNKNEALQELERKHKEDSKFIELDKIEISLENKKKETKGLIDLIKEQVNQEAITEQAGRTRIINLELEDATKLYEVKKQRFELVSGLYDKESEEYKTALAAMSQAHALFTNKQTEQRKQSHENEKINLEKSSLDYQLELKKRLDWLKDSERDGSITHQQAARDKLEAEKNYLAQVAELRRRELAAAPPDTVEYKQALAAKYQADREYAEAKRALDDQINAENIGRYESEAAEAEKTSKKEQESFRSFAQWFYAQWDAITNKVVALGPKVAAAFGVSVKQAALDTVEGLRAKLEEVAAAVRKADEASRDWFQFGRLLGEHAEKAEQLTYRYYSQRLAVAELTEQLKKMGLATDWQVQRANSLIKEMDLLNDSDLDDVRSEVDRLTESLKEAQEQAEDTVDSLRDELDEMLGNKTAIEERDYEAKKDELLAKLDDARKAGDMAITQEYQEALTLLEEIHKRKMANIKEEAAAAKAAREATSASTSSPLPGFARGGQLPGDSPVDSIHVMARPGEWFINNEAVKFWDTKIGRGFMAAINEPWSRAGHQIQERLTSAGSNFFSGVIHLPVPKSSFATGGQVADAFRASPDNGSRPIQITNYFSVQELNERTVRREVIPVLEKCARLKR
jgi:tape measure domain-containing protein